MREAIINLTDEELEAIGFDDLVSVCRQAGVREVEFLEDHGRGGVAQVAVENRLDENGLDTIDCVDSWEFVTETEETYIYLIETTALEMPESASQDHDELIGMCDPTVNDRGLLLSLVVSQETIRDMLRNFEEAGVVPDLHRLGEYEGGQRALEALTSRQLEILQTAYGMGFYDVPKKDINGRDCGRSRCWPFNSKRASPTCRTEPALSTIRGTRLSRCPYVAGMGNYGDRLEATAQKH